MFRLARSSGLAAAMLVAALACGRAEAQTYGRVGTFYSPSPGSRSFAPTSHYYTYQATEGFNGYAPSYYSSYMTSGQPTYMTSINYPTIYGAYGYQYAPGRMVYGATQSSYTTAPTIYGTYVPNTAAYLTGQRVLADTAMTPVQTTATVDVRVPEDAELTFQGVRTSQSGPFRRFQTPTLDLGMNYSYDVRATWTVNGREVTRDRHVAIRAGDHLTVDFFMPGENTSELRTKELP